MKIYVGANHHEGASRPFFERKRISLSKTIVENNWNIIIDEIVDELI